MLNQHTLEALQRIPNLSNLPISVLEAWEAAFLDFSVILPMPKLSPEQLIKRYERELESDEDTGSSLTFLTLLMMHPDLTPEQLQHIFARSMRSEAIIFSPQTLQCMLSILIDRGVSDHACIELLTHVPLTYVPQNYLNHLEIISHTFNQLVARGSDKNTLIDLVIKIQRAETALSWCIRLGDLDGCKHIIDRQKASGADEQQIMKLLSTFGVQLAFKNAVQNNHHQVCYFIIDTIQQNDATHTNHWAWIKLIPANLAESETVSKSTSHENPSNDNLTISQTSSKPH